MNVILRKSCYDSVNIKEGGVRKMVAMYSVIALMYMMAFAVVLGGYAWENF